VSPTSLPEVYPGSFDEKGRPEHEFVHATTFRIFAQQSAAAGLCVDALDDAASRHLGARIGAMLPRREWVPRGRPFDGATIAVKFGPLEGTRALLWRPLQHTDLALVSEAVARGPMGGGLDVLARRCESVFLVAARSDEDDVAMVLAEVCARAYLGPVLTPSGELLGPKSLAARR
jgi:hypothetical protein